MDKKKDVESIAHIYCSLCEMHSRTSEECYWVRDMPCPIAEKTASEIYNAGFGDVRQAVKEAFEKLKSKAETIEGDYYDAPCFEMVDVRYIDELFTELYGVDNEET